MHRHPAGGAGLLVLLTPVAQTTGLFLPLQIRTNILACFRPEYKRTTFMLMAVWFTMSFR